MAQKKKCFCYDDNVSVKKNFKTERLMTNSSINVPCVLVVKIEDDPKLLDYIAKNIRTDFVFKKTKLFTQNGLNSGSGEIASSMNKRKFNMKRSFDEENGSNLCFRVIQSPKKTGFIVGESSKKKITKTKHTNPQTSPASIPYKVQVMDSIDAAKILEDVTEKIIEDKNNDMHIKKSNQFKNCNPENVNPNLMENIDEKSVDPVLSSDKNDHLYVQFDENGQVNTLNTMLFHYTKLNNTSESVAERCNIIFDIKPCMVDLRGTVFDKKLKNIPVCSSANHDHEIKGKLRFKKSVEVNQVQSQVTADNLNNTESSKLLNMNESSTKQKNITNLTKYINNSVDLEEPLSLITKLTGCHVAPSKVEILPLPCSCINIPSNNHEPEGNITIKKLLESHIDEQKPTVLIEEGNSRGSEKEATFVYSESIGKCSSAGKAAVDQESDKNSRTLYEVMNDMSLIMPSWNLHILPDTNTFCIGQVTRNRLGIPYLSKCIELDDNFNAKVYIYQQRCKQFDGMYNSEETVVALLNEIDNFP
ncbi:uncharacterized protein LOC142327178 [Lycorma delicatula]|uniref:uncharacterized protein LOC142327178 n=1 Tax=Lycorma delicatula TaxID=130591 RepID=UPI003F50EF15